MGEVSDPKELRRAHRFALLYGRELPRRGFVLPDQPEIGGALAGLAQGQEPANALRPVQALMKTLDRGSQSSPLCNEVLLASYRTARLIDRCLEFAETGRNSTWLSSVRQQLANDHWLSPLQVERLQPWFKTLDPRVPALDPNLFAKARPHKHQIEPF